jgi:hypothetical protein
VAGFLAEEELYLFEESDFSEAGSVGENLASD